jgi:hypothetical protein
VKRPPYPPSSRSATTFEDLFVAYLAVWPDAAAEAGNKPRRYAKRLYRHAQAVAGEYADVDFWRWLDAALMDSMRWYSHGPFDCFFEANLRHRLQTAVAKKQQNAVRRARREGRYVKDVARRVGYGDVAEAYHRWSLYLLDAVSDSLDPHTRLAVTMRRKNASRADIAQALGVSEKTVTNKYGKKQLARRVRTQVRRLVLGLPDDVRALLVSHLIDEVGLSVAEVESLLAGPVTADVVVPVRGEGAVLEALGWTWNKARALLGSWEYKNRGAETLRLHLQDLEVVGKSGEGFHDRDNEVIQSPGVIAQEISRNAG